MRSAPNVLIDGLVRVVLVPLAVAWVWAIGVEEKPVGGGGVPRAFAIDMRRLKPLFEFAERLQFAAEDTMIPLLFQYIVPLPVKVATPEGSREISADVKSASSQ
jgi:hypothetical protein